MKFSMNNGQRIPRWAVCVKYLLKEVAADVDPFFSRKQVLAEDSDYSALTGPLMVIKPVSPESPQTGTIASSIHRGLLSNEHTPVTI